MKTKIEIIEALKSRKPRSAWDKGVAQYALELIEDVDAAAISNSGTMAELEELLLDGAGSWDEYARSGYPLWADEDIARRLTSPSVFKRSRLGTRGPGRGMTWIDMQADALRSASRLIRRIAYSAA